MLIVVLSFFISYFIYKLIAIRFLLISQLKEKEEELEKVKKLNGIKNEFFSNISHELRTPLSLIILVLSKLKKSNLAGDSARDQVDIGLKSINQLVWLADEIMYFRKLEAEEISLNVQQFDLTEYLKDIINLYADEVKTGVVSIELVASLMTDKVGFDKGKLHHVLSNLITYVINQLPKQSSLFIELSDIEQTEEGEGHRGVQIAIIAKGKGGEYLIKEDNGHGLALEIVGKLVEIMHGDFQIVRKEKIGVEYLLIFPINLEIVERIDNSSSLVEEDYLAPKVMFSNKKSHVVGKLSNNASKKDRLLIAEDNEYLLHYLSDELHEDYEVHGVENGEEALSIVMDLKPKIIITDVMMPLMNGIELCDKIKTNPATRHILVVILTAGADSQYQKEGFEVGADAYMSKPFDIDLLRVRLQTLLKNYKHVYNDAQLYSSNDESVQESDFDSKFISKINKIVSDNFRHTNFNVESFASDLNMSRSQLFRKLKLLTGQTPSEYLFKFRVNQSMMLLEQKDFTISEIACKTGFSSPNSFTKTFKKHVGVSPSRYVKQ